MKLVSSILLSACVWAFMCQPNVYASSKIEDITPVPAEVTIVQGYFRIDSRTALRIEAPAADVKRLTDYINKEWRRFEPGKVSQNKNVIILRIADGLKGVDSEEGYVLNVGKNGVEISSKGASGLFYGVQTLIQLAEGESEIPCLSIVDEPRYPYRGMMLDISRNFRDKEFIKKQIDAVAKLKINRVHLHLTDAAGWRLEIKKYPRLTDYAAWRPQQTWKEWAAAGAPYTDKDDFRACGGYLTQEDAREIVEYAADRYITVIPEIEMPSHSEELTAAFPALSCTHKPTGEPDVCVGNEKTFEVIENILDEVIDIFPSEYIHIGGDEASKQAWKNCELCKQRMADENLEDVDELQSYLISRIEKYLNSKGRNIIGWDEIMEGGLAPNATVMSWRGVEGGIKAAHSRHKAIMSPGGYCYLDNYQDAPATQPEAIGGYLPLEKVYSYNPTPDTLASEVKPWIQGVQGNLWCEYIPTAQHAEYMLYPRMVAIAEIGWSPQERRDWNDFRRRAEGVSNRMRREGYTVFDLSGEVGNRRASQRPVDHLALGKKVTYNVPWWKNYTAAGEATLTDGNCGGWSYHDGRWQGFLYRGDQRLDVTIDLEKVTPLSYVGADFMQITGPGVWFPSKVEIYVSEDGEHYTLLKEIDHEQKDSPGLSFKTYSWEGHMDARYVKYVAKAKEGCLFTDEIVIR